MAEQSDLFGFTQAQGSLFGAGENRLQEVQKSTLPDPEKVRLKLTRLLDKARSAQSMPWPEREARMWQVVFPQMTNWLPKEEAAQLRFQFEQEWERLMAA